MYAHTDISSFLKFSFPFWCMKTLNQIDYGLLEGMTQQILLLSCSFCLPQGLFNKVPELRILAIACWYLWLFWFLWSSSFHWLHFSKKFAYIESKGTSTSLCMCIGWCRLQSCLWLVPSEPSLADVFRTVFVLQWINAKLGSTGVWWDRDRGRVQSHNYLPFSPLPGTDGFLHVKAEPRLSTKARY